MDAPKQLTLPPSPQRVADLLHLFFCDLTHCEEPERTFILDPELCKWYLEESIVECWECTDHAFWLDMAEALLVEWAEKTIYLLPEVFRIEREMGSLFQRIYDLRNYSKREEK